MIIEEKVKLTWFGRFSVLLFVLNALACLSYWLATTNLIQEITVGIILISGSVFWGVCIFLNLCRSYEIKRDQAEQ
jgi:hypothetical protein